MLSVGLPSAACANATKFLSDDKIIVALAAGRNIGACGRGNGICQRLAYAGLDVERTLLSW